jgi:hypothetical protein
MKVPPPSWVYLRFQTDPPPPPPRSVRNRRFELRPSQPRESTANRYTATLCDRLANRNIAVNSLLACDAVLFGKYFPTFRNNVLASFPVSASRRTTGIRKVRACLYARVFLDSLALKTKLLRFLRNVGNFTPSDTALHSRRLESSKYRCENLK